MSAPVFTPVESISTQPLRMQFGVHPAAIQPQAASGSGFGELLVKGLHSVDAKLNTADALVRRFAVDDTVPVHQVTMALEEARLSVELAMQVRGRLVEAYRDLMNMQL